MVSTSASGPAVSVDVPEHGDTHRQDVGISTLQHLAFLHREAVENARHARLLEHTPAAAAMLIALCLTVTALESGAARHVAFGVWIFFVLTAAIVMLRLAKMADVSGPRLLPLRGFVLDLNVTLLFAGFSWGAGAFLALPPNAGDLTLVLFGLSAASLVTGILRTRAASSYFLVPALALTGTAGLTGPSGAAPAILLGLAGLGLAIGGRVGRKPPQPPIPPASPHCFLSDLRQNGLNSGQPRNQPCAPRPPGVHHDQSIRSKITERIRHDVQRCRG